MDFKKVWVGTSKNAKLSRIYLLQTGQDERNDIYNCVKEDLNSKVTQDPYIEYLNGNALIDDIPYYVEFSKVKEGNFLMEFKEIIDMLLSEDAPDVIQFSKNPLKLQEIINFEDNEGVKFIATQTDDELFFMHVSNNSVLKNKYVMSFDINENSVVHKVPKGIQIPQGITAKLEIDTKKLFVYDVNRFENMLTLNENKKAKATATLNKFINEEYKISSESYVFKGLDSKNVQQALNMSNRALRRLAKYEQPTDSYSITKIKEAVAKLEPHLQVDFDDTNKTITINQQTAKTFVGIIHNSIVMRLISGEVEITI